MKILEIGCGRRKFESSKDEVTYLDIIDLPGVDIVHDLNKIPFPFENNKFDLILANHVLEHLNNLIEVMEELYRILKPFGLLRILVPYFASPSAFIDPTHKRYFTLGTFDYFSEKSEYSYYSNKKINFKVIKKKFIPYKTLFNKIFVSIINKFPYFYEMHLSRLIPAKELEIILQKR